MELACVKPGACLSGRDSPPGVNVHSAAVSSSGSFNNSSSSSRGGGGRGGSVGTSSASLRGEQLPRCQFRSASGLSDLVRENLSVAKRLHMCSRSSSSSAAAAAAGSGVNLSATAKMEAEDSQKDAAEPDVTEPASEAPEDVSEFRLSGDETELKEVGHSFFSVQTAEKAMVKTGDVGKQFVMNNIAGVVGIVKMVQRQPEQQEDGPELHTDLIERKDGVTAVHEWSATELTMQHDQLARIAIDINYLVFAFAFCGWVRILEAIQAVFSTYPPVFKRMLQSFNALDYLTIAWLAYNLRKSIISILQVDPTDLQRVAMLKIKLWDELHAFFERQWKVMAMVAVARFLGVVASSIPPSHWMTKHFRTVWDIMRAISVF